jgi:predicted Zn-dependent protease
VADGGSYRLLRIGTKDGHKTIVMRMAGTSGINYHEYLLANEGGQARAVDLYIYLSAERISETLRRTAIPLAQHDSRNLLQRLTRSESAFVANMDKIQQMTSMLQQGRHEETMRIYRQLPIELQQDKNMLLIRYQAAVNLGEAELTATLSDFRAHHPHDVGVDFMLIDYYVLKKEFEAALASIDRLDQAVGGDRYLDTLRAEVALQQGDQNRALQLAEKAVAAAEDLTGPRFTLIAVLLATKDYTRTLREMREVEDRFSIDFGNLSENAIYADFLKSKEGEEWQRSHRR